MPYRIVRTLQVRRDIRAFFRYLRREAGAEIAMSQYDALENDILRLIATRPHTFSWFHETGKPYRAKLFKVGRTAHWLVYRVDENTETIKLLRFWNSARKPGSHGL